MHILSIVILISRYVGKQQDESAGIASLFFALFVITALSRFAMDGYIFYVAFSYFRFVVTRRLAMIK
jgi:hypothetical protein